MLAVTILPPIWWGGGGERLVIFTMLGEYPRVESRAFPSSGRNAAETKNWAVTFVFRVSCHRSNSDFIKWSEMACASEKSGDPCEEYPVLSRAMPALLTKRWTPLGSCLATSSASHLISDLLLMSPGSLMYC